MNQTITTKNPTRNFLRMLVCAVVLLGLTATSAKAQNINTYSFAQTSTTYAQVGLGADLAAPGSGSHDDDNFALVTIPFSFTYHGTAFTSIGVSANGYARFGAVTGTFYSAVLGSQNNTLAPFAQDLYGNTTAPTPGARCSWATTGTPGSRAFVIQWTNWGFYSSALNEQNFQIKLFEGTNIVQFCYGAHAGTTATTVYVGLNGAAVSDISARTTAANWAATTAGTSASTCSVSSTIFPANGSIFQWTSAATCAAMTFSYIAPVATNAYIPIEPATTQTIFTAAGSSYDDANFGLQTMPFSFTYHGTPFTTVSMQQNGYAQLGGTGASGYSPICSYGDVLCPIGADLYSLSTTVGRCAGVYVTGTSPNRTYILQWENWGFFSTGLNEVSFQIRLKETANTVQYVYGPAPGVNTRTAYLGLTGTAITDFQTRTTTTNWAATTVAGAVCTSTTVSSTVRPTNGLTFTWSPPTSTPCSGTPAPGATLSTAAAPCTGVSFTLSMANAFTGISGLTYQWQSSPDNITYTNIAGATSATRAQTQTAATYYRCVVTCTNSGLSGNSTPINLTMSTGAACLTYCASTATATADDEIFNVTLGTLNNTSTCASTAPGPGSVATLYSNYRTSVTPPNLVQLVNYSGAVTVGFCSGTVYTSSFAVYIDYNQNGVFTDAGEMVYVQSGFIASVAGTAYTFNITIPVSSTPGQTVMRIVDTEGALTPPSCGTYTWGETEDYLVNIVATTGCTGAPTAGAVTSSANPVCAGVNFNLSLTGSTIAAGLTYQWQSSPTGSGYTNISGATSSVLTTTQSSATYYQCVVTCTASALSATSTPLLVNQNAPLSCYCTPAVSTSALCCAMYISNITTTTGITNINNSSIEGAGSYTNYSATVIASQLAGSAITITGTTNGYGMDFNVYIDYNDNGLFTDAGELVTTFGNTVVGSIGATFTVPVGAPAGTHRMRVRAEYYGSGYPAGPCTTLTYGETEDYGFQVILPVGCSGTPNPGNTLTTVTPPVCNVPFTLSLQNAATIGSGITYQWQSSPNGSTWTNIAGATSNTYTGSQTVATYYYCYTTCTASGLSALSSSLFMSQNAPTNCYCTPPVTVLACTYDWIGNVTIGSINNTTGCATSSFTLYPATGSTTTNILAGSPAAISLSTVGYSGYFDVFIDLNQDGTFQTTERVLTDFLVGPTASSFGAFTGATTITVPITALAGTTRMRVRYDYLYAAYTGVPTGGASSPCGQLYEGETEDYVVTIVQPAACTGAPSASTTLSTSNPVCSATSFTLSLGTAYLFTGMTYQWQSSPTGTTYTNIAGATSATYTGTQTAATFYQCVVTCTNSGLSITSTPLNETMLTGAACLVYCVSNATSTADDEILNVSLGTMSNTSICGDVAPGPGSIAFEYSNYRTSVSPPTIITGLPASGSVTVGFCSGTVYTSSYSVYIDWNQNGVFTDAGENVYNQTGFTATVAGTAYPFTITVPAGATIGTTVMRVVDDEGSLVVPPCATYTWGETEDYLINVINPTPCSGTPTAGTASSSVSTICGAGSAILSLSGAPVLVGLTYQWQQSINAGAYTNITAGTTSTYNTGTLSTTGSYTFRCVVTCTNSGISSTSTVTSVVTVYAPASITPGTIGLCAGASATATASPAGATSYVWSGGSTATTPSITVTTAGTYTCTVTQGSCVTTASASASVSPLPVITSATATPATICNGDNSQLAVVATGPAPSVTQYSFAATSGTFTPLTGGTAEATILADDAVSAAISLGFTFNYAGVSYTQVVAGSNGELFFGTTGNTTTAPDLSAMTPRPYVAPLGDDMHGGSGTASYLVTGSAPNRVFTFEWLNWRWYYTVASPTISFQCKLYEVDGKIQFIYRQESTALGGTENAVVGLAGVTAGSYLSLNNFGTSPTASSTTQTTTINAKPANGQTYTFTPPAPSYSWSPATFLSAANIANPLATAVTASTTYTVTAITFAGCTATATVPVTVNPLPVGSASGTGVTGTGPYAKTICSGANTSITLNSSIASAFAWTASSTGPTGFTASGSGSTIGDILTGVGTVTYIVRPTSTTGSCIGAFFTVVVTINAVPTGSATPAASTFCSGGTTSIALSGGTTYTWTVTGASGSTACSSGCPSTITQTLTNVSHTVSATVNYSITPISALGCVGTVFHAIETVRPTPTFTGGPAYSFLCSGSTNTINLTASVASTYTWTTSASAGTTGNAPCASGCGTLPVHQTLTNSGTSTGYVTYTITPTSNVGSCVGTPVTIADSVGTLPAATVTGPTVMCTGDVYSPTVTIGTAGALFTWASGVTSGTATGNSTCGGSCGTLSDNLINTGTAPAIIQYIYSISTATCSGVDQVVNLTVNSNTALTCPANIAVNSDAGACGATVSFAPVATGGSVVLGYSQSPGTMFAVGTTTVNISANGSCGTAQSCSFDVTVTDAEAPAISCPSISGINTDAGICTSSASIGLATSTDNCSVASVTVDNAGPYSVGSTTVTWTATDVNGNTSSCSQTFMVSDNEAPALSCGAAMTENAPVGVCSATVAVSNSTATDNCAVASLTNNITGTSDASGVYPVGTTLVLWTATDVNGGVSTCSQSIIVTDYNLPVITCPATANISADAGACTSSASIGNAVGLGNCTGVTVTHSPAGPYAVGTTTVTWTATDGAGTMATCSQDVVVTDDEMPAISCPATANITTDAGMCTSAVSIGSPTATDNCTGVTVSGPMPAGPYSLGSTIVTWTATDAYGHSAACSQTVNVSDTEAPVISCPATSTISTDAGLCTSGASIGAASATDNCSGVTVSGPLPAGPYALGNTTVTWTAADANGNTSACSQVVTVADNEAPVMTVPASDMTVETDGLGNVTQFYDWLITDWADADAVDNCTDAYHLDFYWINDYTTWNAGCGMTGNSGLITFQVYDQAGNYSLGTSATFYIIDTVAPVISGPASVSFTADGGLCTSAAAIGSATATDDGGLVTITHSPAGPYSVGTTTVVWSATDACGNVSTASQTVTVSDSELPAISCPATANLTTDAGLTTSSSSIGSATATDNCAGVTVSGPMPAGPYSIGTTVVTWTATDAHANTSACTQTVNVSDSEVPVITCPSTSNNNTDAGLCSASSSIGAATATDNAPGVIVSGPLPAGPYSVGSTTVQWTATDVAGNISTCAQVVVITDNEYPITVLPAHVTVCSLSSSTTVSIGTATATDNCGVASTTNNAPIHFGYGTTVVTWTTTDVNGNIDINDQYVTVNPTPEGANTSQYICDGNSSSVDLATPMPAGATFTWTAANTVGTVIGYNGCPAGCGTTISDVLSNLGTVHGDVVYTITPTSDLGCTGPNYNATVTVGVTPAVPASISGPAVVCGLTTAVYSITPVTDATSYTWTVPAPYPPGMLILSGQGTTSITVQIAAAIPPSTLTVTATNSCGTSATRSLNVTRKPGIAGPILGPTSTCGISTATYNVTPVIGASTYTWTLPTGVSISPGGATGVVTGLGASINVNLASSFAVGNINVAAVNTCGSTPGGSITVTGKAPATPGTISGTTNVCGMSTGVYTVPAVAYASGYTWTVPSWMTINSGQGTTAINVTATGTPATSSISVAATNVCGTGVARTQALTIAAIQPGAMTGPTSLCGQTSATYSVASVGTGYTYTWVLTMFGWTITSGQGTTAIVINGPSTGASTLGIVKVSTTNSCSTTPSALRTLGNTYCHSGIANGNSTDDWSGTTFSPVYPNPTATDFRIDVTTDLDKEITLQVYDVLGNIVASEKHQIATGTSTLNTKIESYRAGMYFVRLVDSNASTVYSQTVIKE